MPSVFDLFLRACSCLILAGAVFTFSGCSTPRQDYLNSHPQLNPEHRRIITAGKFIDRDPVAGMTKEEIRLTMGTDPMQTTTINGEEAWIWLKKKPEPLSMMDGPDRSSGSTGSGSFSNIPRESDQAAGPRVSTRTTVFFQGNQATRVDVTEESGNSQL